MYYTPLPQSAVPLSSAKYVRQQLPMLISGEFGMSYAVISDREHYRMLKYIYISRAFADLFRQPGHFRAAQALLDRCSIWASAAPEVRHA
jgi:hypothetical protein